MPQQDYSVDQTTVILVLALGGAALGMLGLFVRTANRFRWKLAAAGLLAALGGASVFAAGWGGVGLALGGLAVLQAGQALFGLQRTQAVAARLLAGLMRPAFQGGLLLMASGGLLCWQVVQCDRDQERELRQTDAMLAAFADPVDLVPIGGLLARTDGGTQVPLFSAEPTSVCPDEEQELRSIGMTARVIRTGKADLGYNCHGWVFTGGRSWVRGREVDQILKENRYEEVSSPQPGMLAVFRGQSGVLHTALVHAVTDDGRVLLESKWGRLGRYIHTASEHAYCHGSCTYYTSDRPGHLLRGLEPQKLETTTAAAPRTQLKGGRLLVGGGR